MLSVILSVVTGLFPISELTLAVLKRSRGASAQRGDRGSMQLLRLCITLGIVLAILARRLVWARIPGPMALVNVISLILLLSGLTMRWIAILTSGRLFTVMAHRVAKEEQALLSSLGPAYSAYCSRTKRFIPGLL